jgi:membrane-associated protease RseP (regulator of RpoE activity)
MKRKYIAIIAAVVALPITAFTQAPPNPPNPPAPPAPPNPPESSQGRHEKMPKVPVTYLGVDTSPVPPVVCEQMSLAKGFGLVVDYVVPDSPAAAAGVQQNDILKMLNDQILLEPSQLAKLVRSYSEGTTVTLTILRKGKEEKVTVKLTKKEVPQKSEFGPRRGRMDFPFGDHDFGDLGDRLNDMKGELGDAKQGMIHDAVMTAQAAAQRVRDQAQRARDQAQRIRDEAQRARDEARRMSQREREAARRAGEQIRVTRTDDTGLTTTKIDIGKAQIVFSDDKGELRIDSADGKRILTAKDPQGRLLFSGPVETKEEIDRIPAEVRDRFEKLKEKDLPSVVSSDEDDEDNDSGDMDDGDEDETSSSTIEQACLQSFPRMFWAYRTVLI